MKGQFLTAIAVVGLFTYGTPKFRTMQRGPQVFLHFERQDSHGVMFVRPMGTVEIGIQPVTSKTAPTPPDTIMICNPITLDVGLERYDKKPVGPLTEIGFQCGSDLYVFRTLGLSVNGKKAVDYR